MGIFDFLKKDKHIYKDENIYNDNGYNKIYEADGTYQVGNKVDGEQQGQWKLFDQEGILLEEINFKNGLMHGLIRQFNDDGILTNEINFKNGESNGILKVFHVNGNIAEEGNLIKDNKKDGLWKYYFEDGTLQHEGHFKNAIQDGLWKHYHANGNLQFEGTYLNGEKSGHWKSFNSDGSLIDEHFIKDGKTYSKSAVPEDAVETSEDKIKELLDTYSNIVSMMEAKDFDSVIKDSTKFINTLQELSKNNPTEGIRAFGDKNGNTFSIIDVYYLRGSARMSASNNDALSDFNKVIDELDPDHLEARYNRAVFYYNFNKDIQRALNDIVVCLDLKDDEKEFEDFHKALKDLYLQSLSEDDFLRIYKCYYETCLYYDFLINDSKKSINILNLFFDNIFNSFYNNRKGVDWTKIKNLENGVEMREFTLDGPPARVVKEILSLNIYHKNILTNLLIDIIAADAKISKKSFNQILRFLQDAGLPPSNDLDLVSKMKNKIGNNPFEVFNLNNSEEQIVKTI
tara:strand:+ start:6770 stop:8311 length:1542 start_codon:yes stop_codon:yes gene_type:complete